MEFASITYNKNVEGNFEVKLVHHNTVIATITFPNEVLAKEYVEIKQKIKAHSDGLIAELTKAVVPGGLAPLSAPAVKPIVAKVETKAKEVVEDVTTKAAAAVEQVVKPERQKPIDASAKVSDDANKVIDTSAKAAKSEGDWQESAKAKVVFPE